MKTLNQEELLIVSGGNDEAEEVVVPATEEAPVEVDAAEVVVAETSFLQAAGAFLSKFAFGCCS
ncbi:MAG: hypothetical protein JSR17_06560 [Proteobacteria bacterium]|nr:hypothetical protein [Pseudomonadota bacterium]